MNSEPPLRGADVPTLASAAERFLAAQPWCARVTRVTPIFAISGMLGVFRCTLVPSRPDADIMVWIVVGDLPSAYLVHEPGDSWQDALIGYVAEMEHWVDAARDGASLEDVIPVNVAPTQENVLMLASRLDFIRSRLLDVDPDTVANDV